MFLGQIFIKNKGFINLYYREIKLKNRDYGFKKVQFPKERFFKPISFYESDTKNTTFKTMGLKKCNFRNSVFLNPSFSSSSIYYYHIIFSLLRCGHICVFVVALFLFFLESLQSLLSYTYRLDASIGRRECRRQ